jgi:hypothetical protein
MEGLFGGGTAAGAGTTTAGADVLRSPGYTNIPANPNPPTEPPTAEPSASGYSLNAKDMQELAKMVQQMAQLGASNQPARPPGSPPGLTLQRGPTANMLQTKRAGTVKRRGSAGGDSEQLLALLQLLGGGR